MDEKSKRLTREEVLAKVKAEESLRDADLRGADLSGADLRYADLRGADLNEVVGSFFLSPNIRIAVVGTTKKQKKEVV